MRSALFVVLVAIVTVAACSSTLDAEDYDTSCVSDADCMIVSLGEMCDCSCDNGAISKKDEARYRSDRADIPCLNQCKLCANKDVPVCTGGTCQAQRCASGVLYCAPSCDVTPTVTACSCPAGTVDTMACRLDAGPG